MSRPMLPLVAWAVALSWAVAAADDKPGTLQWKAGAASPFERVEAPTAVIDGKLFLFGGFSSDLGASAEIDVYDPAADQWTRRKDMPTPVTHLNPAVDGKTVWFAGGFKGRHPGPVTDEVWKYDVDSDTWSAGPPLPEGRGAGALEVVGGLLHFVGGYKADRVTNSADHWALPLPVGADKWRRGADLPDPRGHLASIVVGGTLYVLGGQYGHDAGQVDVATCQAYDAQNDGWTPIASLPDGRSHFESSTMLRGGKILIAGGRCNASTPPRDVVDDLVEYDPATNRWRVVGTLPKPLLAPSAGIIDGRLIVTSGGLNNPRPLVAATYVAPLPAEK